MTNNLEVIRSEIETGLANKDTQNALLSTVFKGLSLLNVRKAMFEGMARGFKFQDFLQKNVYAIPFGENYSLMTSIDYARKLGMRGGVCGKSEPIYEEKDGKIISCMVTIKRKVGETIGEYTAKVYFDEYKSNKPLWISKPRTMIAKVAEMHALRMACPEELSQTYVEEEMEKEIIEASVDEKYQAEIDACKTVDELKAYYTANKGKGKLFDKAVKTKRDILLEQGKAGK